MDLTKWTDQQLDAAIARLNGPRQRVELHEQSIAAVNERTRRAPIKAAEVADQQRRDSERWRAEQAYRAAGLDPEQDRAGFERFLSDQQRSEAAATLQRQRDAAAYHYRRSF